MITLNIHQPEVKYHHEMKVGDDQRDVIFIIMSDDVTLIIDKINWPTFFQSMDSIDRVIQGEAK